MIGSSSGFFFLRTGISRRAPLLLFTLLFAACGGGGGGGDSSEPPPASSLNLSRWPLHAIDDRFRGATNPATADVNGDGLPDFVAGYTFDQRYVVTFHPGFGSALQRLWPSVVAFVPQPLNSDTGVHPEGVTVADFDGDGNPDLAGAQGYAPAEQVALVGNEPGVRLVWGPTVSQVNNAAAWADGGVIPATAARGHFLFVQAMDVDSDGALDIVAGGRVHADNGVPAGLIWIEAPEEAARRRDLSAWQVHDIDPNQVGGSAVHIEDVDADGNPDLVLANAGVDTPAVREEIVWYENPAPSFRPLRDPWPKRVIYANSEFENQPPVAIADLDRDGRNDVLTATSADILWFRKVSAAPVTWRLVRIPKDPAARQPARGLQVADLDEDGRLDLIGLNAHTNGVLPNDRAAAFWMAYTGSQPAADNWTTNVIKWGAGQTMGAAGFGETWGEVDVLDLDNDGDLDLMATCSDWFEAGTVWPFSEARAGSATVALRWFENRLQQKAFSFTQRDGLVVMEAEHWTDALDGTWMPRANYPGFAGDGYLQNHVTLSSTPQAAAASQGVNYRFDVAAGDYYVWVRRWVPRAWGQNLGGEDSDSAWLAIDGQPLAQVFDEETRLEDQWIWARTDEALRLTAGSHTLNLRVREGGYAVDRLLLSSDPTFVPAGVGPSE